MLMLNVGSAVTSPYMASTTAIFAGSVLRFSLVFCLVFVVLCPNVTYVYDLSIRDSITFMLYRYDVFKICKCTQFNDIFSFFR
jgi:hypothetical protein